MHDENKTRVTGLRIHVYAKDLSILKLLTLILEKRGHHVKGFTEDYSCSSCSLKTCSCSLQTPCIDAVIINSRDPVLEVLPILYKQNKNGCKLKNKRKVIMSCCFKDKNKIQSMGYHLIKKPFSISAIDKWLETLV